MELIDADTYKEQSLWFESQKQLTLPASLPIAIEDLHLQPHLSVGLQWQIHQAKKELGPLILKCFNGSTYADDHMDRYEGVRWIESWSAEDMKTVFHRMLGMCVW